MFVSKRMTELLCNYSCLRNQRAELLEVNVTLISSEAKDINKVSLSNITTTALDSKQKLVREKPQHAGDIQAFLLALRGRRRQADVCYNTGCSQPAVPVGGKWNELKAPWPNFPAVNGFSGDIHSQKIN